MMLLDEYFAATAFDVPLTLRELYKRMTNERLQVALSFNRSYTDLEFETKLANEYYHKTMINAYSL